MSHPFFDLSAFNVLTLQQIVQRSCLARLLETLHVDICYVSETRIQDPALLMHLRPPRCSADSGFTLRVSGDSVSGSRGYAGVWVALSTRVEKVLLEWIPKNSRLCNVRLDTSVRVNKQRNAKNIYSLCHLTHKHIIEMTKPRNPSTENFLTYCKAPINVTLLCLLVM